MTKLKSRRQLTRREMEIVHLVARGWSNQKIAAELCMTLRTVKFHTTNLYSKIKVSSRAEAIVWAWKNREILCPVSNKNCTKVQYPGFGL